MKAIVYRSYGGPGNLELTELPIPKPSGEQLLVRVHATSVNPLDFKIASGKFRPVLSARLPQVPGYDVAGEVVHGGAAGHRFPAGARVHAHVSHGGGAAEYALVSVAEAAVMPAEMDYGSAAGLPLAGLTALQGLRDAGRMPLKDATVRVLVLGASGGVGHLAVQIARAAGASVVAVCSGKNRQLMDELGVSEVIDYHASDPYRGLAPVDIVLDCVGQPSASWLPRLRPKGCFVSLVPGPAVFARSVVNGLVGKKVRPVFARPSAADLSVLDEWVRTAKLRVVVERRVALQETRAAWEHAMTGRTVGKLIVDVTAP